jgi:carboxyl-terminal processing protease
MRARFHATRQEDSVGRSLQVVLLAALGIVLLAGGFSGGFIAGHFLPLDGFPATGIRPAAPAATVPASAQTATPADLQTLFKPFWEAWQIIHAQYVDQPVDDEVLMEGALRGMMDALGDPHSSYMDPQSYKEDSSFLSGSYEGIGATVDTGGDYLTIISTFPESPAENAGLLTGDQIIALDRVDMTGTSPELVLRKVLGPAGTPVHLTVAREGENAPLEFDITRAEIHVDSATSEALDGGIGYVQISSFGENTTRELKNALRALLAREPAGLILDLRNNGGGFLDTAVEVVSQFQGSGIVLYEEYGDGKRQSYSAEAGGLATKIPLVVLIDAGTASAAEITAGALQDQGRATLVGTVSFGKGSVQNWVPISNEGAVKVTIAHWLTPDGRLIEDKGLTPDVYVERTLEDRRAGRDPQLDAAVEVLRSILDGRPLPTSAPTALPTTAP